MYLTAQRVVRTSTGETGINAFFHEHGRRSWNEPPVPENDPGKLVSDRITVAPPGNRVRSYIDIVAPDGTAATELFSAFAKFLARQTKGAPLPWIATIGACLFRVGMDGSLAKTWRAELVALVVEAIKLQG